MSIKVCHITVAHNATDVRIFEKESKSLLKYGYDVCIIAPNEETRIQDGVKIVGVELSLNPVNRIFFGARKIFDKALEIDADIYHFHDIELFSYSLKLKNKGKKVIFDSHEDWIGYVKEVKWLPALFRNIAAKLIEKQYRKHLNEFDSVITVSPHIVENLSKYKLLDKINLVTNYPKINVREVKNISFEDYFSRKDKLCYAGTVYNNSSQEAIITAISNIENISYTIVGILNEGYMNKLSNINGWDKVDFIDRIPKNKLLEIYNSVTCGIVVFDYSPNCGGKKGTMGNNKIFEYMLAGLPIICTDFNCWKDLIVDKYECGICVRPNNAEDIKEAIDYLMQNKQKAYQMGENGRRAVLEEFNWSIQEKELLNIYKKIL